MRAKAIPIMISAVFASTAFGQETSRIFNFASTDTVQDIQEVATLIKAMGDIQQLTTDNEQKSLVVRGTTGQIALAEWLFGELDKPSNRQPLSQQSPDPATNEYRMQGGNENVVRVFYLKHTATLQDFQEVATLVRSIADIRRIFTYNEPRAMVMRGTADQAGLAEWLVNALDTDQPKNVSPKLEYRMPGGSDDVVRLFFPTHTETAPELQEMATVIRSTGDIRRLFTYNAPRAIAMRGTADQAALSEWLFGELDQPASTPKDSAAAHEYRIPGTLEDVVNVSFLQHAGTVAHFQQIVVYVRTTTRIRRAFTYNGPRAVVLRGTAEQIAQANQLIQERDKP